MPLVKIALRSGRTAEYAQAVGRSVHRAMVETINVPEADEFQIITEHSATELVYHPTFLGIQRTDDIGGAGVDGDFGSGTELAVRDFQSDKGLAADGIVAGRTWIALRGTE